MRLVNKDLSRESQCICASRKISKHGIIGLVFIGIAGLASILNIIENKVT